MAHPLNRPLDEIAFLTEMRDFAQAQGKRRYDYGDNYACATAKFLIASGRAKAPCVGFDSYWERGEESLPDRLLPAGTDACAKPTPHTYAALATRIDALIPAHVGAVGERRVAA